MSNINEIKEVSEVILGSVDLSRLYFESSTDPKDTIIMLLNRYIP